MVAEKYADKLKWWKQAVSVVVFGFCVLFAFYPVLQSFFDPQDFLSFLNPLGTGMPVGKYMVESWSWVNDQGKLIGFFRPLVSTTFLVEYPLFGVNPIFYKLVNLFMHIACGFFAGRFVMMLSGRKRLALFSGALFVLHPGTVVATGMIVSRHDILVCMFSILALSSTYSLSRYSAATRKAFLPSVFMFLALNSKELGMINLIALPVMYFFWPDRRKCRRNTLIFVTTLVAAEAVYLSGRLMIFGDIGGYGQYTPLSSFPVHIARVISQTAGAYFMKTAVFRLAVYSVMIYIPVNFVWSKRGNWREVLTAILVTGAYSAQSVIGDTATHYVYTASAFAVIFLVYMAGSISVRIPGGRRTTGAIAVAAILAAGVVTRRESQSFRMIYTNGSMVFSSLMEIHDSFSPDSGSVCCILLNEDSSVGLEMKNVPIYMKTTDPGIDCEFTYIREEPEDSDYPVLVWEGDGILVR
jgi:hypothetical protein